MPNFSAQDWSARTFLSSPSSTLRSSDLVAQTRKVKTGIQKTWSCNKATGFPPEFMLNWIQCGNDGCVIFWLFLESEGGSGVKCWHDKICIKNLESVPISIKYVMILSINGNLRVMKKTILSKKDLEILEEKSHVTAISWVLTIYGCSFDIQEQ